MADDDNAEHANAIRRIITLPVREEEVFFKKTLLLSVMCMAVFIIEALSLTFCTLRWFGGENGAYVKFYADSFKTPYMEFVKDLFQNFGYFFCMLLPVAAVLLLFASACILCYQSFPLPCRSGY